MDSFSTSLRWVGEHCMTLATFNCYIKVTFASSMAMNEIKEQFFKDACTFDITDLREVRKN